MRSISELLIKTVVYTAAINTGLLAAEISKPPQPITIEHVQTAEIPPTGEPFTLSQFFEESDKLKDNPNLFLGRKFSISLDQNVFAISAVQQEELKSEDGEELKNYIVQGKGKNGSVKFLIVNVPKSQIGEGLFSWPPSGTSGNPSRPRLFPKNSILELEGKQFTVGYQASTDRTAKLAVSVLVSTKIIPPKPEFARTNP